MAISKEALTYLQELETIENWTDIPNDDERIIKLRKLFQSKDEEQFKRNYGYKVVASIHGVELQFNTVREAANSTGQLPTSIRNAISTGNKLKGMRFRKVEE